MVPSEAWSFDLGVAWSQYYLTEGETDDVLRNSASYSEERERLWVERNHLRELAGGTFIGHFNDHETAGAPLPMVRGGIFM